MPDVIPEQQITKAAEATVVPRPAENAPAESSIGAPEQAIIQKIQTGSNPDETLKDIAKDTAQDPTASSPDKPKLGAVMTDAYLRRTDDLAKQLLIGELTSDKLQDYIFTIREQGVPAEKIEEVLLIRGISVKRNKENATNAEPNSEVEILRRAMTTEPLEVTDLRENPIPQEQILDRKRTLIINQGDQTVVQLDAQEWFKIDGKIELRSVNGHPKNFIFMNSGGGHAEYNTFLDAYQIGQKGLDLIKSDPELAASVFLHEAGHDRYMSLSKDQQRTLNDIFLKTPLLRNALFRFGTTLYGDGAGESAPNGKKTAGENYLKVHSVKKGKVDANIVSSDNEKGIKDTRSLVFNFNDHPREVYASALITEYISYMAQLEMNREVFGRFAEASKVSRGGKDPRTDAIFLGFKRLQADPQIQQAFESFGIFKDNTPQLINDFTKIASAI